MVFSSNIFLYCFFPSVFLIYWIIPKRFNNYVLLASSLFFYLWDEGILTCILIVSISINYLSAIEIERRKSRIVLWLSIFLNLSILFFFKYFDFAFRNIQALFFSNTSTSIFENYRISLPIGISFFTFQGISYLVDVNRGIIKANKKISNVALYISFFPQLIAGPIVRYVDIQKQLDNRNVNIDDFVIGLRRFAFGLGKKVLIADSVGLIADSIFALPDHRLSFTICWIATIAFTLQIYFDFSGYSDMAIGLARIFGFRFNENFNYPYVSKSIREFWNRWHISLSTWFKDYLYIPLGGNRKGIIHTYINLLIVFILCGFWHGANLNFVVWGLFHGLFISIERSFAKFFLPLNVMILNRIYVWLVVCCGWVLFRTETMHQAVTYLQLMMIPRFHYNDLMDLLFYIQYDKAFTILLGIALSMPIGNLFNYIQNHFKGVRLSFSNLSNSFSILILFLSCMKLSTTSYNPFIYFRF